MIVPCPCLLSFSLRFCSYSICIVLAVSCAVNLRPWNISEPPPPSTQNSDIGSSTLHPLSDFIPPPAPHLSLLSPAVWTLGRQSPVGQYGDCVAGAQEKSSSNLFQGEAGSASVEVHQAVQSRYGAFTSLSLLGEACRSAACCLSSTSVERTLWNVHQFDWLSSLNNITALPLHSSTEK